MNSDNIPLFVSNMTPYEELQDAVAQIRDIAQAGHLLKRVRLINIATGMETFLLGTEPDAASFLVGWRFGSRGFNVPDWADSADINDTDA